MTEQSTSPVKARSPRAGEKPSATAEESPKYLWRSGELVEWEEATVHVSLLGWTAISAVFEGIRAYWNPDQQGSTFSIWTPT